MDAYRVHHCMRVARDFNIHRLDTLHAMTMFPVERMLIINALIPLLQDTEHWNNRWDIEAYVSRCVEAGFATTGDAMRLCAARYIAGKRKISQPGTARRKLQEKKMREMLANTPPELLKAIDDVITEQQKAADQFRDGNDKAINSLVGGVMKRHRTDAAVVRELLTRKLRP